MLLTDWNQTVTIVCSLTFTMIVIIGCISTRTTVSSLSYTSVVKGTRNISKAFTLSSCPYPIATVYLKLMFSIVHAIDGMFYYDRQFSEFVEQIGLCRTSIVVIYIEKQV